MPKVTVVELRNVHPDYQAVIDVYVANGWGSRADYDPAHVRSWFERSTSVLIAQLENQALAGWARVLSDGHSPWVPEIVVRQEHQRASVGRALMEEVLRQYGHTAIYADALSGNDGFFAKFGLVVRPSLTAMSRAPS